VDIRPVVAIDIDGVLSPLPRDAALDAVLGVPSSSEPMPGYTEHELTIPTADVPNSPFVRGRGQRDLNLLVRVNPAHGRWITSLLNRGVDVVWATTWERAANLHYAPLLGIPTMPLGCEVEVDIATDVFVPRMASQQHEWKTAALRHRYAGRPLVWIDDSAALPWIADGSWRDDPTLVIAPESDEGLTQAQMRSVDSWLRSYVLA
jgi:hypothetical protein